MSNPIETFEYKDHIIEIHLDETPFDPREEFEPLGTMACWHSRYKLGDVQPDEDYTSYVQNLANEIDPTVNDRIDYWENGRGWAIISNRYSTTKKAAEVVVEKIKSIIFKVLNKHYIILPLYLYDHSGITISTGPFFDPWDSGRIGIIYISKEKAKKEFDWKNINSHRKLQIENCLESEVKLYDDYLTGNVYGYVVKDPNEKEVDSCWGFFGTDWNANGLFDHTYSMIDCLVDELEEERRQMTFEEIGEFYEI